jgi:hypothetical protein
MSGPLEPVPLKYLEQPHEVEDWADVFNLPRKPRRITKAPWDESMMAEGKMVLYVGWSRNTEFIAQVIDRGAGAGQVACACRGTGRDWGLHGEIRCIACKGTGWVLVSIP